MFIININYKKDLSIVDQFVSSHRQWLDTKFKEGLLLCSGPRNPRDGGVIIALGNNKSAIEDLIKDDPYYLNSIADYTVVQFDPLKYHHAIKDII